ncbi:neural Wiskott-Aldrich syndrome protein-like [Schistocerca cancellata]|uniref:neural Wiskott-Aldrich syndrome protein-like n=1 Tax=Schistocerca cancellata TaxID=274614 RepID=UPI002118F38D|nr:neural Wiskott-Aldrich syndrome protein-like [Schistocerca cancellata]
MGQGPAAAAITAEEALGGPPPPPPAAAAAPGPPPAAAAVALCRAAATTAPPAEGPLTLPSIARGGAPGTEARRPPLPEAEPPPPPLPPPPRTRSAASARAGGRYAPGLRRNKWNSRASQRLTTVDVITALSDVTPATLCDPQRS